MHRNPVKQHREAAQIINCRTAEAIMSKRLLPFSPARLFRPGVKAP